MAKILVVDDQPELGACRGNERRNRGSQACRSFGDGAPIFGIEWRFYDSEPTEGNSVGIARFERTWRQSIRGKWIRTRERSAPRDTRRPYEGSGYLRDRKVVLCWVAADRPDTFGALVLAIDEDCREMKGYTVYTPQDTGVTVTPPIWFKRS